MISSITSLVCVAPFFGLVFITSNSTETLTGNQQSFSMRPIGWVLAWLAQVAGLALGFLVDMMFVVGGLFTLLFVVTFVVNAIARWLRRLARSDRPDQTSIRPCPHSLPAHQ